MVAGAGTGAITRVWVEGHVLVVALLLHSQGRVAGMTTHSRPHTRVPTLTKVLGGPEKDVSLHEV